MNQFNNLQRIISGACLILVPLLILISESIRFHAEDFFFWHPVLSFIAFALSIQAILGLRHLLHFRMPRMAVIGCGLAMMLILTGSNIMTTRLIHWSVGADAAGKAAIENAIGGLFPVIFLPGVLYPLVRMAIGISLWRARIVPVWVGLLIVLGYILFPVGRISSTPLIIHLSDVILLFAEGWLGWKILTKNSFWEQTETASNFE